MISYYCGPQTVGILRNYRRLMSNGLVLSGFPNLGRERLRQEPYLVLVPTTTISLNVPVPLVWKTSHFRNVAAKRISALVSGGGTANHLTGSPVTN